MFSSKTLRSHRRSDDLSSEPAAFRPSLPTDHPEANRNGSPGKSMKRFYSLIAGILPIAIFLTAWPEIMQLVSRWDKGDNSYCYLIVPLFFYLCWGQRRIRAKSVSGETPVGFAFSELTWCAWGLIPVLLANALLVVGRLGSVETLLLIGLWLCVVGVAHLFYGKRIKHLWFNLLILAAIVPLPPFINRMLTFKLKLAASSLSVAMLRFFDISVLQDGNIIDLGITRLQVVDACSGMRYLIPMFVLALLIGHFFCRGLWRRVLLLVLVPPLSVFINALRILLTGLLLINGHEQMAQNVFHDFAGLVLFLLSVSFLGGIALGLKRLGKPFQSKPVHDHGNVYPGGYRPAILTVLACLMFVGSGWGIDAVPAGRTELHRDRLAQFPINVGPWAGTRKTLSPESLDGLASDDYSYITYRHNVTGNYLHLLIPYYTYQDTGKTAHAPQSCMLGTGWALASSDDRVFEDRPDQQIKVRTIIWRQGNASLLAGYYFLQRGRVIISPWLNKFYLFWDGLIRQRTDGALVRAELQLQSGQSMDEAWSLLSEFYKTIWPLLSCYIPGE